MSELGPTLWEGNCCDRQWKWYLGARRTLRPPHSSSLWHSNSAWVHEFLKVTCGFPNGSLKSLSESTLIWEISQCWNCFLNIFIIPLLSFPSKFWTSAFLSHISHQTSLTKTFCLNLQYFRERLCSAVFFSFFFFTFSFFVTKSKYRTCKISQKDFGKNNPSWENYKKYFQIYAHPPSFSRKPILWNKDE